MVARLAYADAIREEQPIVADFIADQISADKSRPGLLVIRTTGQPQALLSRHREGLLFDPTKSLVLSATFSTGSDTCRVTPEGLPGIVRRCFSIEVHNKGLTVVTYRNGFVARVETTEYAIRTNLALMFQNHPIQSLAPANGYGNWWYTRHWMQSQRSFAIWPTKRHMDYLVIPHSRMASELVSYGRYVAGITEEYE